jgi:L-ascorbate metabolism protein UlaG (beta-lactamase superfamily)
MHLTWYGVNSWLFELQGLKILVDPWLAGSLVFGGQSWLFEGKRRNAPIPAGIDLVLLSQGLEDHAHPPTLSLLDKTIPVVGSPKAAKVARDLGFTSAIALDHGEIYTLGDRIEILATVGALTGIKPENGYLLKDLVGGATLYYEPHGFFPASLKQYAPVNIAISPMANLELPLLGALVQGQKSALELATILQPQYFLPTAAGSEGVEYAGLLISLLRERGGPEELRSHFSEQGISTQIVVPNVGERIELNLAGRTPKRVSQPAE